MKHVLFDLKECPSDLLDDETYIKDILHLNLGLQQIIFAIHLVNQIGYPKL